MFDKAGWDGSLALITGRVQGPAPTFWFLDPFASLLEGGG